MGWPGAEAVLIRAYRCLSVLPSQFFVGELSINMAAHWFKDFAKVSPEP
jgi:hypothetical protein